MLDVKIETFLAVCRNMSFTKAANELFITQPAVSQHIKYLEKYYGTKLFSTVGEKLLKSGERKEIQIPDFRMEHEFNMVWNQNSVFTEQYNSIMDNFMVNAINCN